MTTPAKDHCQGSSPPCQLQFTITQGPFKKPIQGTHSRPIKSEYLGVGKSVFKSSPSDSNMEPGLRTTVLRKSKPSVITSSRAFVHNGLKKYSVNLFSQFANNQESKINRTPQLLQGVLIISALSPVDQTKNQDKRIPSVFWIIE